MSTTGRGSERREADFYPTPGWVTERLLQNVALPGGMWLEPSAGEGHIIRAADRGDVTWTAVELRDGCAPVLRPMCQHLVTMDFLGWIPRNGGRFDLALGNPPYLQAREHLSHALTFCDQVIFLLSVGFLASKERRGFFEKHGAPDVYVLPDRPSFTDGGTDSTTYAWMRWRADRTQEGRVSILYDKRQASLFEEDSK